MRFLNVERCAMIAGLAIAAEDRHPATSLSVLTDILA